MFVSWFRHSAPYIRAHRNKTFVISFAGEAVKSIHFADLIHDIALLHALGIRLVLVHGARSQIQDCLQEESPPDNCQFRVTDNRALECVKTAAGAVRVEIEGLLSMGLANSPMAGASINVFSGNFVTAKPMGIKDGVDYQHTGLVRRIDTAAINQCLDGGAMVLIPPLGYARTGEVFNLNANQVAMQTAMALKADKLLCLLEDDFKLPAQLTVEQAQLLIKNNQSSLQQHLSMAIKACEQVNRIHFIARRKDGALLAELFTLNGIGTLITKLPFGQAKTAKPRDIAGILELINPLVEKKLLVARSKIDLAASINQYQVIKQDNTVIACAALFLYIEEKMAELACLAVHIDYGKQEIGEQILASIEKTAISQNIQQLFVLTTETTHWFRERGFKPAKVTDLPPLKQKIYNKQRNSGVLIKTLKLKIL